jgi:LacI family transcriptional regulator
MDDLSKFCCQNSRCPDHGKRGGGNLTVGGRYGENKQYRLLYCRTCKARFSERKGTPLFRSRLPRDKSIDVLKHLAEGCGIRQTERLTGVHRDTVTHYARVAGDHARALHDEIVSFSPGDP